MTLKTVSKAGQQHFVVFLNYLFIFFVCVRACVFVRARVCVCEKVTPKCLMYFHLFLLSFDKH